MRKTIVIARCAARAWHETMKFHKQLSRDKYQNPLPGAYVDTAFVAHFLNEFVNELVKTP